MGLVLLPWILRQENAFQRIENTWKPVNLFTEMQAQKLMTEMVQRFEALSAAKSELATLDRADKYLLLLRRMGFNVRRAKFSRRANQLSFVRSLSDFYTDYGTILRFLKFDSLRGKLSEGSPATA